MNKLPDTLINAFSNKLETSVKKYFRLIPEENQEKYLKACEKYSKWQSGIPFAIGVFGEILSWSDDGYVILYNFPYDKVHVIIKGESYFTLIMNDKSTQEECMDLETLQKAEEKIGELKHSECYIFEPIPALGGNKNIENISKGDALTYINLIVQLLK